MKNTRSSTFNCTFSLSVVIVSLCARARRFPVIQSPCRLAVLAVIPVQEEERERAHDQEEQDPDPEASVVFDCLVKEANKMTLY